MKWSAKLGRFARIDVYVHVTFLALLAWFALIYWRQTGTAAGVATGLALILLLFLCVLLHEYGHALAARRYGIGTRHITLLPIGGIAMLDRVPRDPRQEIVVALAGPAVNVAIAAVLYLVIRSAPSPGVLEGAMTWRGLMPTLLVANLVLAVFNLLPAFPMDGGRVLRAALSFRMDRVRATRTAATIGQGFAILLGFLGLAGNPFLILIAVFVWIGAASEAGAVEADAQLSRQPAARAMITDFRAIGPAEPLGRAIDLTLAGSQRDFPVVEDGRVLGVLTQGAILRGLRDHGAGWPAGEAMQPAPTADASATLAELLQDIQLSDSRLVCILANGRLAGIVDLENLSEYLRIQSALAGR